MKWCGKMEKKGPGVVGVGKGVFQPSPIKGPFFIEKFNVLCFPTGIDLLSSNLQVSE